MFDTHAVARALTGADLTPMQADAVRQAAEHDAPDIARRRWPRSRTSPHPVRRCRRTSPHLHASRLGRHDPTGAELMGVVRSGQRVAVPAPDGERVGRECPAVVDGGR